MDPEAPTALPTEEAELAESWFENGEIREPKVEPPDLGPSLDSSSSDDDDDDDEIDEIEDFNRRVDEHNQFCQQMINLWIWMRVRNI